MYYIYVIESKSNGDLYKGFTRDINRRVKEHNSGITESTKTGIPWRLVYCEVMINKEDAIKREKYLKSGWGRKYLGKILKNYFENKDRV